MAGTLRLHTTGADVRALQEFLNDFGVGLEVDGRFGPMTRAAVQAFQQAQGLHADGVVGPQTWQAIDAIRGGGGEPAGSDASPAAPASASSPAPAPQAAPGSRRQAGGTPTGRSRPPGKTVPQPPPPARGEAQPGQGGGRLASLVAAADPSLAAITGGPPVSGAAPTRAEFLAGQPVDALYDSTRFAPPQSFPGMGYGGIPSAATGNSATSALPALIDAGMQPPFPLYMPPLPPFEGPPGHIGLPPGRSNSGLAQAAALDIFEKAFGLGRFAPGRASGPPVAASPAPAGDVATSIQNYQASLNQLQELLDAGNR